MGMCPQYNIPPTYGGFYNGGPQNGWIILVMENPILGNLHISWDITPITIVYSYISSCNCIPNYSIILICFEPLKGIAR
jgi:hypothetical protein